MTSPTQALADYAVSGPAAADSEAVAARTALFELLAAAHVAASSPEAAIVEATAMTLTGGASADAGWRAFSTAARAVSTLLGDATAFVVWAALLELDTDRSSSLEDAFCVGVRAASALARAGRYRETERGLDAVQSFGTIAATLAGARLAGLDAAAARNALSIATSEAGGLVGNLGSDLEWLRAGAAARHAVQAVLLAARGYRGAPDVLEGRQGFGEAFFGVALSDCSDLQGELERVEPVEVLLRANRFAGVPEHQRPLLAARGLLADAQSAVGLVVEGVPSESLGALVDEPTSPWEERRSLRAVLAGEANGALEVTIERAPRWAEGSDEATAVRLVFADGTGRTTDVTALSLGASPDEIEAKWHDVRRTLGGAEAAAIAKLQERWAGGADSRTLAGGARPR